MSRSSCVFGDVPPAPAPCYRNLQVHTCVRYRARRSNRGESMAKSKLRILYGEGDEEVLKAQAAIFEKAGHSVQAALGRKAVDEAIRKGRSEERRVGKEC